MIVFGQGKEHNGLLLSPARVTSDASAFVKEIWPLVVQINKEIPKHSIIVRELVLVAIPNRPFALTDKGTVRAKATLSLYETEIQDAYQSLESAESGPWKFDGEFNVTNLTTYLVSAISELLSREISVSDDLFDQGNLTLAIE